MQRVQYDTKTILWLKRPLNSLILNILIVLLVINLTVIKFLVISYIFYVASFIQEEGLQK